MEEVKFVSYHYLWFINKKSLYVQRIQTVLKTRLLIIIQQGIYFNYDYGKGKNWPFQLTQNLNADMFCGYMHDAKPLNGGSHNSDYNMQDGWNSAMWGHTYAYIFPQIYQSEILEHPSPMIN